MVELIIVRHGQSLWNLENRFTGWKDIDLTEQGKEEARRAGIFLKHEPLAMAFTSTLKRAQHTLSIILEKSGLKELPIEISASLNERSYGALEGLNKAETAKQYGEEQVHIWRRSYDVVPPGGESLEDTADRVLDFYKRRIVPELQAGKNVLVVAHGNSLRALKMYLENLDPQQIAEVEIPTGVHIRYVLDEQLKIVSISILDGL